MPLYKVNIDTGSINTFTRFSFKSEGEGLISPQALIYNNPKLIINIPELEIQSSDNIIVTREFNTNRGAIDVLMITSNADIIIFDEPTHGIDVGAKADIYQLLRELSDEGKGIILVSSELPEILNVCDRILVFRDGKIVHDFEKTAGLTEEDVVEYALG